MTNSTRNVLCKSLQTDNAPIELSKSIHLLISMAQFKNLSLQPKKCGVLSEFHGQVRRQGWEKTWGGGKFLIYACKQ